MATILLREFFTNQLMCRCLLQSPLNHWLLCWRGNRLVSSNSCKLLETFEHILFPIYFASQGMQSCIFEFVDQTFLQMIYDCHNYNDAFKRMLCGIKESKTKDEISISSEFRVFNLNLNVVEELLTFAIPNNTQNSSRPWLFHMSFEVCSSQGLAVGGWHQFFLMELRIACILHSTNKLLYLCSTFIVAVCEWFILKICCSKRIDHFSNVYTYL